MAGHVLILTVTDVVSVVSNKPSFVLAITSNKNLKNEKQSLKLLFLDFHAYQTKSPVAFAENPLSFTTPLRSERTDAANEVSGFKNDIMYTPQRWGVYPFKGISTEYEQPVMDEYPQGLLGRSKGDRITTYGAWKLNSTGHFYKPGYSSDGINRNLNLMFLTNTHTWNWTTGLSHQACKFGEENVFKELSFSLHVMTHKPQSTCFVKGGLTGRSSGNTYKSDQLYTHTGTSPGGFADIR